VVHFPKRSADESVLRLEPENGDHFGDLDLDRFGSYSDYYYVADILSTREYLVVVGHASVHSFCHSSDLKQCLYLLVLEKFLYNTC